ncbi:hypothetical protein [Clostridium luticellarii]|jgi:hypothetical protein|nr:hypothetical protein [Clostridium luticellarii]
MCLIAINVDVMDEPGNDRKDGKTEKELKIKLIEIFMKIDISIS